MKQQNDLQVSSKGLERIRLFCSGLLAAVLMAVSFSAQAVVIDGKDWRQITDTVGYSWNDLDAIFDTSTGGCDVVACLLGKLDLTGYKWASAAEVDDLLFTYTKQHLSSVTISSSYSVVSSALVPKFFNDFVSTISGISQTTGLTRDSYQLGGGWLQITDSSIIQDYVQFSPNIPVGASSRFVGAWLHKDAVDAVGVSVPTSLALFGLGLAGLGLARKKRI